MKIIIKNSTVEFKTRDVELLDQDITFSSTGWQYFDLKKSIGTGVYVKTIANVPQGTTLSAIQIKPYINQAVVNTPVFLYNQYNEENEVQNNLGNDISKVGVYVSADSLPVTINVHMELS